MRSIFMCPYCKLIEESNVPFCMLTIGRCRECEDKEINEKLEHELLGAAMRGVIEKNKEILECN